MHKRLFFIFALIITGLWVMPVQAAGSSWTAWLYEAEIGRMTKVDSSGTTLQQFQLPNDISGAYSQHAAVSADGLLVAYGATSSSTNQVYIFDLTTNKNIYTFDVPQNASTSFDFSGGPLNFSEGDSTFAFSYANVGIPWTLVVIDIVTFSASSLKQNDPIAAGLGDTGVYFIPVVAYNRSKQITFLMIPLGTDGSPTYPAYTWNRDSNTISPNNAYITPDTDTFTLTNEVISTISDDNFPENRMEMTDFPSNNTLQVFDPALGQRYIVTSLPRIYNPRFIQGGERVVVTRIDGNGEGPQTQTLQVLERSGGLSGIINNTPADYINGLLGTTDGFIFSVASGGADPKSRGTTLYFVQTRQVNGGFNAISTWNSPLGASARLIWVSDSEPVSTGPFTSWGHINPPAVPPTQPAAPANGSGSIAVGMQVRVQTTDNDVLNIRSGPGRSFARLGTIGNGTIVIVLEGPQNADGLIWWRVRTPAAVEGWVVDSADGVQTLVPN
ncbi:MAG: SH3 domain-containing protein [Anaerolineaceae bacterium]|nr:SH3 domain-containing protein [Anaerolineaceae bacterium]